MNSKLVFEETPQPPADWGKNVLGRGDSKCQGVGQSRLDLLDEQRKKLLCILYAYCILHTVSSMQTVLHTSPAYMSDMC